MFVHLKERNILSSFTHPNIVSIFLFHGMQLQGSTNASYYTVHASYDTITLCEKKNKKKRLKFRFTYLKNLISEKFIKAGLHQADCNTECFRNKKEEDPSAIKRRIQVQYSSFLTKKKTSKQQGTSKNQS